jgi:DNA-binding CsgD family transcriptional regulator
MESESGIIRDIYASALDERPWRDVVARIAGQLGATGAFLVTPAVHEADGGLILSTGLPEAVVQTFVTELATVDVWLHELIRRHGHLRTGLQWATDDLVPERELRRTRFFADYLVPCEIGRNLGVIVDGGSSAQDIPIPLCFYRPVGSQPFTAHDAARLAELRPHFTQAMALRLRLFPASHGLAELAMERLSTAVAVLARDRRILFTNLAADELLRTLGLKLVTAGKLCAHDPAQAGALDVALAACSSFRLDGHRSLSVRLAGPPGCGVVARLAPPPASIRASRAAAIAFLTREGRSELDPTAIMISLYKLTPAEAALVKALSEGLSLEQIAECRQVALPTVRTQLQSVFNKTATKKQSDLMRLVYSVAR